jgi:hypothetical protein
MNGFLVTFATSLDDLPIGFFATREAALAYANGEEDADEMAGLMGRDRGVSLCTAITEFAGGRPVRFDIARDLEQ